MLAPVIRTLPPPETAWQIARDWLTAVGTIGAAGAAVYFGGIRDRWRRPELALTYDPNPAAQDCVVVNVVPGDPPEAAYYRLRVENRKNRTAAEEAEVIVVGARSPDGNVLIRIEGMPLVWSNTNDVTRLPFLPGGTFRHVDLVMCQREWPMDRAVQFEVRPRPSDARNRVGPGGYEIELAVTAKNTTARRFRVHVSHDAKWGPGRDSIRDHLMVIGPTPV